MHFSTKGEYAVRAIFELACSPQDRPISLKAIAKQQQLSLSYLEQIFLKLRRGDIVKSVRGPGGGYVLARPPEKIRLLDIMDSVQEPIFPSTCLMDPPPQGKCHRTNTCVIRDVWGELGTEIRHFLSSITIKHLCDKAELQESLSSSVIDAQGGVVRG